jgi:hypothetical protein
MNRSMKVLALVAALAMPVSGFAQLTPTTGAPQMAEGKERYPEIHAAMAKLREARDILERKAGNDFEGHKKQAIESTNQALEHLRQALAVDQK